FARGAGRARITWSSVAVRSFTSCTLAPLATIDSGTPRPSTNKLRLRPFFSPIRGVGPHALHRQRSFGHGPVHALPVPGYAFHLVILGQSRRTHSARAVPWACDPLSALAWYLER